MYVMLCENDSCAHGPLSKHDDRIVLCCSGADGPWKMPSFDPVHVTLDGKGAMTVPALGYGFVVVNLASPACKA